MTKVVTQTCKSVVCGLVLLLAGCGGEAYNWQTGTVPLSRFAFDHDQCMKQGDLISFIPNSSIQPKYWHGPWGGNQQKPGSTRLHAYFGPPMLPWFINGQAYEDCMVAMGYRLESTGFEPFQRVPLGD